MSDVITQTKTLEVVIEPLDGTGRRFVLFGLRNEKLDYKVYSPTRRTVSNTSVTQQRMVSRRTFTLQFAVFEPTVGSDGQFKKPNRSAVYEETDGVLGVTAQDQLDKIHQLAKLSEAGTLIRYTGISVASDRCAITSFSGDLVYVSGQGTLTIEERTERQITLDDLAISADAFNAALQTALGTNDLSDTGVGIDKVADGTISPERYTKAVQQFIKQAFGKDTPWNVYLPKSDQATLDQYGLGSLPYVVQDHRLFHDNIVLFPDDGSAKRPKLQVIPVNTKLFSTTVSPTGASQTSFNIVVNVAGLFIRFEIYSVNGFGFSCHVEVYDSTTPPTADSRTPTRAQITPDQAAPVPVPAAATGTDFFTGAPINAVPVYTVTVPFPSLHEVRVADQITFAFIFYGKAPPPSLVDALDISTPGAVALVIADYRGT